MMHLEQLNDLGIVALRVLPSSEKNKLHNIRKYSSLAFIGKHQDSGGYQIGFVLFVFYYIHTHHKLISLRRYTFPSDAPTLSLHISIRSHTCSWKPVFLNKKKKNTRVVVCGRNFFSFFIIAPFCQEVLAHVRHRISGANEVDIHDKKEGGV